jgi:hypothetical protein
MDFHRNDWRFNIAVLKRKIADVSLTYVKGAKHHVINERSDLRKSAYHAISVYWAGGEGDFFKVHMQKERLQ